MLIFKNLICFLNTSVHGLGDDQMYIDSMLKMAPFNKQHKSAADRDGNTPHVITVT